jgi:4-aminobutyrate aminotransferase-like enzyme
MLEKTTPSELAKAMRNETTPGVAIHRVAERINGDLSPAAEAYLHELTLVFQASATTELMIAKSPMVFDPSGLSTPESQAALAHLAPYTSAGSKLWVLRPGICVNSIQAGVLKVAGPNGKTMLNFLSAASSLNLGGQHPDIETADAYAGLRFGSNNCSAYHPMEIEGQAKQTLAESTPGNHQKVVIFESTGGAANDRAIEAAILHQLNRSRLTRNKVVACSGAYHGNIGPSGAATDFGIRARYEQIHGGSEHLPITILPYPDTPENTATFMQMYSALVRENKIAGILVEAIQGDGGMREMSKEAAEFIVATNEEHDLLTIWDEVQSGMGRSGKFLAVQLLGERVANSPQNAFTMAKALANGYPISATILPKDFDDFPIAGALNTMMGNASGLVRMMTAIETINQPEFLRAVQLKGEAAVWYLNRHANPDGHLRGGRGRGLMLGAEITRPGMKYIEPGSSEVTTAICYLGGCGILAGGVGNNGLRLHPRLTVEPEVLGAVLQKVVEVTSLMDSDQLPYQVHDMVSSGKSGLDR